MANVTGTAGNDFIHVLNDGQVPPPGSNVMSAATNSADRIDGAAGNDTVYAGSGNDTLIGSAGVDILFGQGGNDRFESGATAAGEAIDGGGGFDTLFVNNTAVGQAANFAGAGSISGIEAIVFGATVLSGATQQVVVDYADAINNLPANLALTGSANVDEFVLFASGGGTFSIPNTYTLNNWTQPVDGTPGDRLVLFAADANDYAMTGSAVADSIVVGAGDDTLNGGAGNDFLAGGAGVDQYFGGDGQDFLSIGPGGEDYSLETYEGGNGFDILVFGGQGGTVTFNGTVDGVESLGFNTAASVTFRASAQTLSHFGNADGFVTLLGSNVRQTANIFMEASGLLDLSKWNFVSWNPGDPAGDPNAGTLDYIFVEGSTGADVIVGTTQRDKVFGGDGNDTIYGNNGADWLNGGAGDDTFYLDVSGDVVVEAAGGGIDTVFTAATYTLGANIEHLTMNPDLNANANLNATGNALNNAITGNAGNNTLNGGAGNDTLTGGPGIDHFIGGAGNDIYVGVNLAAGETITEAANGGTADHVHSAVSFSLADVQFVERLTLTGTNAANGTGDANANIIIGNTNKNILDGGGANDLLSGGRNTDTLIGGAGNDTLAGGSHADTFVFATSGTGNDTITDFETVRDLFDLSGGSFTARTHSGGNTILTHSGGLITINGIVGLTLAQWNAFVLPASNAASEPAAETFTGRVWDGALAKLHSEMLHLPNGDWVFA